MSTTTEEENTMTTTTTTTATKKAEPKRRRSQPAKSSGEAKSASKKAPAKKATAKTAKSSAHPLAHKVGRPLTASTELFLHWLEEQTGYTPDPESVALARALVGDFQKSDVNQKRLKAEAKQRS